jgi:hypothetical protein
MFAKSVYTVFGVRAVGGRWYPIDTDEPVVWVIKFIDGPTFESESKGDVIAQAHRYYNSVIRLTGNPP